MTIPVDASSADAITGQERAQMPIGKGRLLCVVTHCQCHLGRLLHEAVTNAIFQFVNHTRILEIRHCVAIFAAFKRQNFKPFLCQFHA